MRKFFFLIAILIICTPQIVAQKTFKVIDYMPQKVGMEWQFRNNVKDGLSPIIVKNAEMSLFGNIKTIKRTENNGDYRLQTITNRGLEVYQLYFIGNRFIEYEKPVLLIPEKVIIGELYKSDSRYKTTVNKELKETGIQTYEVKPERIEDVKTPLRRFRKCLVFRTIALRIDESGLQKGYELEEWYAKGFGAVKVVGTLFWKNAKGDITRTFRVDAEIEKITR